MRIVPAILLIVFTAGPVWAQEFAAQEYVQPSQQQVSGNYVGQPYYPPAQPRYQPEQKSAPQSASAVSAPQAGESGYSPVNDLRQLNF